MADIDPTNPADNAIVSQFPSNERASRVAIETNLYLEHGDDVGRHQFGVGNDATRDAITNWVVGSFWLNNSRTPVILQRTISIDPDVWENVERTNAQIKVSYESNSDTNEFSDVEQTKLSGISTGAEENYDFGGYINGLQLANSSGDAVNDIDVAVGVCAPDNIAVVTQMKLATLITKRIDANWAVGTNQGGFPSALSLTNDTWYHVFLIKRTDTGVVDAGFDTSLTAVNLLADATNYDAFRRVGSVRRATAVNLEFSQNGDYIYWKDTVVELFGNGNTSGASLIILTPPDVVCLGNLSIGALLNANGNVYGLLTPLTSTNAAATTALHSVSISNQGGVTPVEAEIHAEIPTDTSSAIRQRVSSNSSTVWQILNFGYTDFRGKD